MALDASRVINGSYGEVHHEGEWLTNVMSVEANVEINYEDVARSGTRWLGKKATSLNGTGTVTGYKITSDFIRLIGQIADDNKGAYVTELIVKLDDPEAHGSERVRFKNVQFETIPLSNWEVGSISEEELPFNFGGFELLDQIEAN